MSGSSILVDAEKWINEALGLNNSPFKYEHPKCQLLLKGTEADFNGKELIQKILDQIESNWHKGKSRSNNQNWRWKKNADIDPKNTSQEVVLERWIARTTDNDWVNQVPVASGLTSSAGGRRAIDLVHRCGDKWYEFIELKVNAGGGTPLFAAFEIFQYGVLYIFSRENAPTLGYKQTGMLGATDIHLKVLAPANYYKGYDLSWLEKNINSGLANFLVQGERGFKMEFKFESLWLIPSCSPVTWNV
jgi:hypothetical protein